MDLRFSQLEDQTQNEIQAVAGYYAFQGFGRGSENLVKQDEIQVFSQKRIKALNNVISLEERLSKETDSKAIQNLSNTLVGAQEEVNKLSQEASKRLSEISLKLSSIGQESEGKRQSNTSKSIKPKRSFTISKPQPITPMKSLKGSFSSLKPISKISSLNRLPAFGSLTLKGF